MVRVQQGTLAVTGDGGNDYAGGTTIESGGRVVVDGTGTALGTGPVYIGSSGTAPAVLSIGAPSNLLSAQVLVAGGNALAVRSPFIPQSLFSPASNGTLAIDVEGFDLPVDMNVLGNGSMSLGSSTTGSYTAATLTPGSGGTYRLGGGGGKLLLTQPNVLTGDRSVEIRGPGIVRLEHPQSFPDGLALKASGTLAVSHPAALGIGPIDFEDGTIRADAPLIIENPIKMAFARFAGEHDVKLEGPITLNGGRTFLTLSPNSTLEIAGKVGDASFHRDFIVQGPGILKLTGNDPIDAHFAIWNATVIVASDKNRSDITQVNQGSTLVLQADLAGSGQVTLGYNGTSGTLTGEGSINGLTTAYDRGILAPGNGTGTITFGNGLRFAKGSIYQWELSALSIANGGVDWDRLAVTGSALTIETGAKLDIDFLSSTIAPSASEPFWQTTQRWTSIINVAAAATHPASSVLFNIDNTPYAGLGSFKTARSFSGKGIDLIWIPAILPGDLNGDGMANIFDVNLISEHWGEDGPAGDANGDGVVDIFDVNVVSDNWSYATTVAATVVPEPCSFVLVAIAIALVGPWRRIMPLSRRPSRT